LTYDESVPRSSSACSMEGDPSYPLFHFLPFLFTRSGESLSRMGYPLSEDSRSPHFERRSPNQTQGLGVVDQRIHLSAPDGEQMDRLCFPLKGYTGHSIGGKKGSGYQVQGYDFFDGNQHRGHPGHDIFIQDKDQDGMDDRTGNPVDVLSVSSGVVVSVNRDWEPLSPVRGGNYVWVYHPSQGRYSYYAHLAEIAVSIGQVVSRGDRLGTVGRTGLNAYPKRSPTHLHFSVHQSIAGVLRPLDPYFDLVRAETQ